MSKNDGSIWYTLGRTMQAARALLPDPEVVPTPEEDEEESPARTPAGGGPDPAASLLTGAFAALVTAGLVKWARNHPPSARRLARGAIAGAAAAGLVLVGRAFLEARRLESRRGTELDEDYDGDGLDDRRPDDDRPDLPTTLLAGAGRGVLYAAFLDPLLPGPPILKGAIVGSAEHFATPLGGLYSALEPLSPLRRVPIVSSLLEVRSDTVDPYLVHLLNGVLLGLLCGRAPGVSHESEGES